MGKYIRADKTKSGTYYWLVEGHRENGKVVQKRLKYLGTCKPPAQYNSILKHIDNKVAGESLYMVYYNPDGYNNAKDKRDLPGWHADKLQPFYITHKPYRYMFWQTRWRQLRKPRPVDWSRFDWVRLKRTLLHLKDFGILPENIWFAKAHHPNTAIAKVKREQGVRAVTLIAEAIFEESVGQLRRWR